MLPVWTSQKTDGIDPVPTNSVSEGLSQSRNAGWLYRILIEINLKNRSRVLQMQQPGKLTMTTHTKVGSRCNDADSIFQSDVPGDGILRMAAEVDA